jgi:Ca2+-dependent lipid-binding protein
LFAFRAAHCVPFLNEDPEEYPTVSGTEFHIRVIEASGLKATDLSGFSDPYVRISLTGNEKFVRRTRKILKTLHPRLNEHFQFDVRSIGNESLKMKVYDWDTVGGDDLIGKIKIQVRNLKVETLVDEAEFGQLRILYHIGFRGDRPFVTSSLVVLFLVDIFLVPATDVPKMDLFGKSAPFCKLKLSCDYEWAQSDTKDETFYPIWDQHFRFATVDLADTRLEVQLWDKNPVSDRMIGSGWPH